MTQCCKRIKDTVQKLASDHKDIHSSVSRVGKAIDKVSVLWFDGVIACILWSVLLHNIGICATIHLQSSFQLQQCRLGGRHKTM